MTKTPPYDKAEDLFYRFYTRMDKHVGSYCHDAVRGKYMAAKEAALHTVEEVLDSWKAMYGQDETDQPDIKYWLEVKTHLEVI